MRPRRGGVHADKWQNEATSMVTWTRIAESAINLQSMSHSRARHRNCSFAERLGVQLALNFPCGALAKSSMVASDREAEIDRHGHSSGTQGAVMEMFRSEG
eukprot:SAG31_NODE_1573_length_7850_cov_1.757193_2_plen_101_part_00